MPQLHLYVSDNIAERLKARAEALGLSVSGFLGEIVKREMGVGWPDGYFETVVGGWQGEALERPEQGGVEVREAL